MFGRTSNLVDQTSEDTEAKQLADFNQSFEAYNKKLMYGTEIITVLNKAADNNKRYGVENDVDSEYYVDIEFTLKSDVEETIETYERDNNYEYSRKSTTTNPKGTFKKNITYSLSKNKDLIDKSKILTAKGNTVVRTPSEKENPTPETYTLTYSPFDEFKRRAFECTGIEYNKKTNRVKSLKFSEVVKKQEGIF